MLEDPPVGPQSSTNSHAEVSYSDHRLKPADHTKAQAAATTGLIVPVLWIGFKSWWLFSSTWRFSLSPQSAQPPFAESGRRAILSDALPLTNNICSTVQTKR
eukprot:3466377-Amphidinium_carterae.1